MTYESNIMHTRESAATAFLALNKAERDSPFNYDKREKLGSLFQRFKFVL